MSTSNKSPVALNATVVWVIAAAVVVNLFFGIFSLVRIDRLHRFYSSVSEEYRALGGGNSNDSDAIVAAATPPPPSNETAPTEVGGRQCVSQVLDLASEPSLGDPNAPVTIVEYSDFECPFCARFFNDSYQRIKSEYIESGQVRLVYKDLPLNFHPLAIPSALVANCVERHLGDEAYFEYHDRIFEQQAVLSESNIDAWGLEFGLTSNQISACRSDSAMLEEIQADASEASSIGINGTPSFVINGELVVGALPFPEFKRAIDDALNGNGCAG